jgi:Tfp pilus assembly protein PilF
MSEQIRSPSNLPAREAPTSLPLVAPVLLILTFAAFAGVLWCGFVNYDDPSYITDNPHVKEGLTLDTIHWAFTGRIQDLYDPVTVLSFALEVQIFGLNPAGFHLDNLLLHAANVFLLYKLLCRMTGAPWRSALVAALWAVHPLRVESVAWVIERKDVLMAFFGLAAMHVYVSNLLEKRRWKPIIFGLLVILSLLSKPALVIMPILLLLLDIWPLGRTKLWRRRGGDDDRSWPALIREKIFVIAICGFTIVMYVLVAPAAGHAMNAGEQGTFAGRAQNALVSCARHLIMMIDFRHLSVFYPIPRHWEPWRVIAAACLLALITIWALWNLRARPWLAVGWFWFLAVLLPVAGLVSPINHSAPADRFTYVASIGLLMGVAWSLPSSLGQNRARQVVVGVVVALILISMSIVTAQNVQNWQDSTTLWRHALDVTHDNWLAECNYGLALEADGQPGEAMPHFAASVRFDPESAQAHFNYGGALQRQGDLADAIPEFRKALELNPRYTKAAMSAGTSLMSANQFAAAADIFGLAALYDPQFVAPAHCSRGADLLQRDRPAESVEEFKKAIAAQPDYLLAHMGLGVALLKIGQAADAVKEFEEADSLNPNDPAIQKNLRAALDAQAKLTPASASQLSTTRDGIR